MNEVELERMIVRLVGDGSSYQTMMAQVQSTTQSTMSVVESQGRNIEAVTNKITGFGQQVKSWAAGILTAAGLGGMFESLKNSVSMAAEFEKNTVAFGTMLQSMDKGKQLMKDLAVFAAKTPLNLPDLQNATKTLLQFGVTGENILPILKMLGDATGGDAERLRGMSLAFGQMSAAGRLMGQDLYQMINAGFNPLQEMAKHAAKTLGGDVTPHMARLKKEMEAGNITVRKVIESFQRATSEGGDFFNGMENASKTLSGLWSTLQDDIGSSLRAIGQEIIDNLDLKQIVKDGSALAQAATNWFVGLDQGSKTAIISTAAVAAGFGLITAAILIAGAVFNTMFGGIGIISGVLITAIAGAAGGVAALVVHLGGVSKALEAVKAWGVKAWAWLWPVRMAISSLFNSIWEIGVRAFVALRDAALSVWNTLTSNLDWDQIRDMAVDAILAIEFALENVGPVAQYAWAAIKYYAVKMGNEIVWVFTTLVPAALEWLQENWPGVIEGLVTWTVAMWSKMGELTINLFNSIPWEGLWEGFRAAAIQTVLKTAQLLANIPALMTDLNPFRLIESIWASTPMNGGWADRFSDNVKRALAGQDMVIPMGKFKIPDRIPGDLEQKLKDEYEKLGAELGEDFAEFRERKLLEWGEAGLIPPAAADEAKKQGLNLGNQIGGAIGKGMHDKLDAADIFSAEALTRLQKYADAVRAPFTNQTATPKKEEPKPAPDLGNFREKLFDGLKDEINTDELGEKLDKQLETLKQMLDALKKKSGLRPINLEDAKLA